MPQLVSARLLGPPQLSIDGAPPPPELLWRKHLALCLILWGAPEYRRSRDQLIGLLWGDTTDRAARHSLNEALRVIRRAAGADTLDTTGDSIAWTIPPDLDLIRFADAESQDPGAAALMIAGPYCDGFSVPGAHEFESWLASERDRWQSRLVNVLVRSATLAENRGDARAAIDHAERALSLNPHSDLAARAGIRGYWISGDRAGALAIAQAHRKRVEHDLDVHPEVQTAALTERVSHERAPARPEGRDHTHRRSPLIGRETVLQQLLAGTESPARAAPALLVVSGASGCGRSRVVDECASRAMLNGVTVITMRAVDADATDPHAAVIGLAGSGLQVAPGVAAAPPAALAAFVARLPDWSERFQATSHVTPMPLRDAFAATLRATADERPILLAIDDADRLNQDELGWLLSLLRTVASSPVTLLVSVRTGGGLDAVDELVRKAGRDVAGAAARLDPLTLAHLGQLVDHTIADWTPDARDRLARRLWAESAGMPAIAVEVLNAVRHGLLADAPAWPAEDRTLDATLPAPLPEPLVSAARIAFRRLPADAQDLLAAAALLDEPFSAERVGRVSGIADGLRRDTALDALEWEDWIRADGRGYTFPARAKRRLVAGELITPGRRRRLEARIAAAG